jgi:hypothetical protein
VRTSISLLSALLLALSSTTAAQTPGAMNSTVGPAIVPSGVPISITISNDTPGRAGTTPCPFEVFDAGMNPVYSPNCTPGSITMGPYGWQTLYWDQRDQGGAQVPDGLYQVRVDFDTGTSNWHQVQIGGSAPGLVLEGTATIGQALGGQPRNFYLTAPADAGYSFLLLGSFTTTFGVPTCAGNFPLDADALMLRTIVPNTIFMGSLGTIGSGGTTKTPTFPVPADPALLGTNLAAAYAVFDPTQACVIRSISNAHQMTII